MKNQAKLKSKPAIFVESLVSDFTKDIHTSNPMAKTLLSQLKTLVVLIDGNEKVQELTVSILNRVKEEWNVDNS